MPAFRSQKTGYMWKTFDYDLHVGSPCDRFEGKNFEFRG